MLGLVWLETSWPYPAHGEPDHVTRSAQPGPHENWRSILIRSNLDSSGVIPEVKQLVRHDVQRLTRLAII